MILLIRCSTNQCDIHMHTSSPHLHTSIYANLYRHTCMNERDNARSQRICKRQHPCFPRDPRQTCMYMVCVGAKLSVRLPVW
jgi:hypothetical protein